MALRWHLGHRPALDGIRGLAIAFVVISHATYPLVPGGGQVGVHLFFALSGFLITALLVEEWQGTGSIRLVSFYERRALRLLPALVVFLAVMALIEWLGGTDRFPSILVGATYAANWARVAGWNLHEIEHIWSLAVEEQFYLIWPGVLLLMLRLPRRWVLAVVCVGILYSAVGSAVFFVLGASWPRVEFGTDLVASSLLLGALASLLCLWGQLPTSGRAPRVAGAAGLTVLALVALGIDPAKSGGQAEMALVGFSLVGLASAGLLVATARYGAFSILAHPRLAWLGRVSYALYLWHFPVIAVIGTALGLPIWMNIIVGIPLSVVLAALSMRYVERPFLCRRVA